jgi:pimeloyl-ACP methyl ester carboxylesterase
MGTSIFLDGKTVNYEALGRGRPVIFLHSWISSWRYWFSAMQAISNSFRAYAIDMWGFGDTAHDPLCYTINQQTDLLSRFLDEMRIGKIAIVGHGLGALVGINFCVRWSQSVDRIMVIDCPLYYDALNTRVRTSATSELIQWLGGKSRETEITLADASKADPQSLLTFIKSIKLGNYFHKIQQTQIPCMLVYGRLDPTVLTPAEDDGFELPLMMCHFVFDKSGHFPMLDEPVLFNQVLMDFLLLDSGISPRELCL